MTNLWGPSDQNRQARGYKDEHHMDFPSNEGALMTIGFLTFAVFLIKLVLVKFYFMVPFSFIINSGLKSILPGKYDTFYNSNRINFYVNLFSETDLCLEI